jgi:hypothetical protein
MKKLSLLISLILCVTIGGVYATWVYTQSTDVADESVNMSMNLGNVTYEGSNGTYEVNADGLTLKIEPKTGTAHTTALEATGKIVIKFTPNVYADNTVKENGVASTYQLSLSNSNWVYNDGTGEKPVMVILHNEKHDIVWTKQGSDFIFEISAEDLADHLSLTEFSLDTKADYDAFNTVLANGQIILTVSDGDLSGQN